LLVLAIVASSALVFTNRVELLKLAVIIALWAAVAAAFVSFIYRRQSDVDQAKARDLKLVYDLQLDREISARREYELSVESQLRRELSSELRAERADEVASLRAELAALRANLEIIFDTDLQHRPAIETERTSVHRFPDWSVAPEGAGSGSGGQERSDRGIDFGGQERSDRGIDFGGQERSDRGGGPGRVISSRLDTDDRDDTDPNTEESPIIDVPEEPHPPEHEWAPQVVAGGAHRRSSEVNPALRGWQPPPEPPAPEPEVQSPWLAPESPPRPPPPPPPPAQQPWQGPEPARRHSPGGDPEWRPAPAEGQFIPAGNPGSNWLSDVADNGSAAQSVPATPEPPAEPPTPEPAMTPAPAEVPRGRHSTAGSTDADAPRSARHSAPADVDPGRRQPAPTLAPPPAPQPPQPPPPQLPESERAARHRGLEELEPDNGQHVGGQPLSELLARLQVGSTGGGRRRRREE
jgi:hypothetical protein